MYPVTIHNKFDTLIVHVSVYVRVTVHPSWKRRHFPLINHKKRGHISGKGAFQILVETDDFAWVPRSRAPVFTTDT
jgi:hypothetical protein